jgi:hypothetical protein
LTEEKLMTKNAAKICVQFMSSTNMLLKIHENAGVNLPQAHGQENLREKFTMPMFI